MRYSVDLRKRVLAYVAAGGSKDDAAVRFAVCRATVYNWLKVGTAHRKPGPKGGRKLDHDAVEAYIKRYPEALLKEIAARFDCSILAIWYVCDQRGLSRKKNLGLSRKTKLSKN